MTQYEYEVENIRFIAKEGNVYHWTQWTEFNKPTINYWTIHDRPSAMAYRTKEHAELQFAKENNIVCITTNDKGQMKWV